MWPSHSGVAEACAEEGMLPTVAAGFALEGPKDSYHTTIRVYRSSAVKDESMS